MNPILMLSAAMLTLAAGMPIGASLPRALGSPPAVDPTAAGDEKPAVVANNAFGLDLFRVLAKESPDKNLFVSPYSMSVALTMAAEGARTQTESEMAKALHFPDAAGGRSVTPVHAGYAALAQRFAAAVGSTDPETRKRIETLRASLDEANGKSEKLSHAQKWQESQEWASKAEKIAAELNGLLTTVDRFDLRVANGLWVERTFSLVPEYTRTIDKFYGTGGVTPLNFTHETEKSRLLINAWVEDHTEKRIKDLLPPGSVTADTRLVITNAVYFKGQWAAPFSEKSTRDEDFNLPGGQKVRVKMMQDHWRGSTPYAAFNADGSFFQTPLQVPKEEAQRPKTYPDDDGFSMIELPYKGGDLTMVLIAPRATGGLPALESKLTADTLDAWLKHLDRRTVDTAMPRFKMEYEHEMSGPLKALGMKRAFVSPGLPGGGGADFGGMSASTNPAEQLYIGLVQHKAWVEVTEKGTEAAAATAIAMRAGSAVRPVEMIPFNPVFRADHPFLFLIRDAKSGVILFIGRMVSPAAA